MDIFHLEGLKNDLITELQHERTPLDQLKILNSFFQKVKASFDQNIFEVYSAEFYQNYFNAISNLSVIGLNPKLSAPIISDTKNLLKIIMPSSKAEIIKNLFNKIDFEFQIIENSINGIKIDIENNSPSFPVIMKNNNVDYYYGQIEKFSVKIHRDSSLKENIFLIIPSSANIEKRLDEQIRISWDIAISYLKNYYKYPHKYHEVVLIFNHRYANIEGYSLGVAITLGFIQELFKFYNTPLKLTIGNNITFTGGFERDKTIKPIGSQIITEKVETVFFSCNNYFALPDSDLIAAKSRLNQLLQEYPKRELKIISLEDFEDLFTHRQIIDIQKSKVIERGAKFVKKNKLLVTLLLFIILTSIWIFNYSIDKNPSGFQYVGGNVNIINSHGKILWSTKQGDFSEFDAPSNFRKVYDIDNDGINEVILAYESSEIMDTSKIRKISCYDNSGNIIWQYLFTDSIATNNKDEKFDSRQFYSRIFEIVEEKDRTVLLAIANHLYFPSAIYKLDIRNGERLDGTFWSQGHFSANGVVGDFDKDGKNEIFIGGINNGLETAFGLHLDYSNLSGQTPSVSNYLFKDIPIGAFNNLILFNKTDICRYLNLRYNIVSSVFYDIAADEFLVGTYEGSNIVKVGVVYRLTSDFDKVQLQIGDDLQFVRDSLVIKGLLKGPLTNTKEFSKNLFDGIKKWDGEKFVKFN